MIKKLMYLLFLLSSLLISSCDLGDIFSPSESGPPRLSHMSVQRIDINKCRVSWYCYNYKSKDEFKISRQRGGEEWVDEFAIVDQDGRVFIDSLIHWNNVYQYKIMTIRGGIDTLLVEDGISTYIPKPSDLKITPLTLSSYKLKWNHYYDWEEGYRVSRQKDNEEWVENYAVLAADSKEFIDYELELYTKYTYRITAFYEEINSEYVEKSIVASPKNLVYIPGRTFTMGRTKGEGSSDELPTHQVTISSFLIGKYQVTQAEYEVLMGSNPANGFGVKDEYPVYNVTWFDAVKYCNAKSIEEGLTPCYDPSSWSCDFSANGYRLPTEAEWECAARGTADSSDYLYSGSDTISSVAVYSGSSYYIHAVGSMNPNSLGIYDMSGNVKEWCNDFYAGYTSNAQTDPVGPDSGYARVARGGGWDDDAEECRVANRSMFNQEVSHRSLGFRVVRSS